MKDFIEAKTQKIYEDFLDNLNSAKRLCKLKELTYEGGNCPDYGDKFIQQYYMLRYFPAYLAEYFLMFKKLFKYKFLNSSLRVLSLGCGCGIDYWGLYFAAQSKGVSLDDMVYSGIDIIKWNYRHNFDHHNVRFFKKDISTISKLNRRDYNVIVFPKSIGEFSDDVFGNIEQILANSQFKRQRICVLCSVMKESCAQFFDITRSERIAKILNEHHSFECLDNPAEFWTYKRSEGIRRVCNDFVYPDEIKNYISILSEKCPTFIENNQACKADCSALNRQPILKTDYINYQAIRFEKKSKKSDL